MERVDANCKGEEKHMHRWIMAVLFFGAAAFGIGVLFAQAPQQPSAEDIAKEANTLKLVATDWEFDQEEYVVEAGSTKTIRLEVKGGIHGVAIEGLNVELSKENPEAEVTFGEAGTTYKLVCNILCGPGHDDMVSTIVVQ